MYQALGPVQPHQQRHVPTKTLNIKPYKMIKQIIGQYQYQKLVLEKIYNLYMYISAGTQSFKSNLRLDVVNIGSPRNSTF